VRRGAKRGSVRVTFESGLDERLYTVYRDTTTGYNIYDPALKMRIADKKEEVSRFLWQHLGVDAGTDLDALYRRRSAMPQGTFTAIFSRHRPSVKKAFDKLLKVEEYRRGAEELLKTTRFIDQQTAAVRERIARSRERLQGSTSVERSTRLLRHRRPSFGSELEKIEKDAAEKSPYSKLSIRRG
jgi:DNA repair exonuclease SbcCD ATPase subunit